MSDWWSADPVADTPRITVTPNRSVPDVARPLLKAIAGSESPDYNVMYGGGRFEDYSDHPRTPVPITSGPNAGRKSTAAGLYQFLAPTWDEVKRETGVPDFSPESQDIGAWHLASKTYKAKTGRDLEKDLTNVKGNPNAIAGIGSVLSGVWTSLPGGIEPNRATSSFASRYGAGAGMPSEVSAQRAQGNWWDADPVAEPEQHSRFTDTPGQNFRTAREGVSEQALQPNTDFTSYIPAAISDVPKEAMAATGDALGAVNTYLNPFSEGYQKGSEAEKGQWIGTGPGSIIGTGKGLAAAASVPFAPVAGAARSLIGHPFSQVMPTATPEQQAQMRAAGISDDMIPGTTAAENYEKAKGAVDTAMMGMGARGGPAVAPRPTPPMPPALQANTAAQNIGVQLPRAISTDSVSQRFLGQVANKMPGGGPMQNRVTEAVRQTGEAVGGATAKTGGTADAMSAGQGFREGVKEYFKPAVKKRVDEAYTSVSDHLNKRFTRPLSETQGVIADIVARRQASGTDDIGKAVDTVLGGATRPGGLTYAGLKDLRTRVGEMIDTGVFPEGMSQAELRRIYGGLSDDLKLTVQAAGGTKAMEAFNRANSMAKFVAEWKEHLGKIVGTDVQSGESITNSILRMAQDKGGDLKTLTMARAAVPKPVWQDIASTAVSRLGLDRKGEFSPAIFLNDFAKLSDRGKQLLFGSVGSGDVLPHLNDIATVSKKFVEAGKLANTSGTAGHNAAWAALTGVGVGVFLDPMTALTIASGVAGNNVMARALSRPASAASIARWTRAYSKLVAGPAPPSAASFKIASGNLANTLNSQFGTRFQPVDFMKAIQAPATGRAEDDQPNVPRPPGQ